VSFENKKVEFNLCVTLGDALRMYGFYILTTLEAVNSIGS